jgi:hypothetical protein
MKRNLRSLLLLLAGAATACSSAGSPPGATGFLRDYSGFERAPDREAAWLWRKPAVDLRDYDKVMLDAPVVSPATGSKLVAMDPSLASRYAQEFFQIASAAVAPYHTMVLSPGPHTLRVRVALTELALGSAAEGGAIAIEGEMIDASTGERVAAVVERVSTPPSADSGEPARAAFRVWANRLVDYLEAHGAD